MLRTVTERDFVACVEIAHRAWPDFKERESIYHLFCKFFSNTCFIEEDLMPTGFLLGFRSQVDPLDWYIHLVAVEPHLRRQGIAARLYERFIDSAKAGGAKRIKLIVNPDNPVSLAFHRAMGFAPQLGPNTIQVGSETASRDYNGPGIHMVPFVKLL